MNIPKFSASSLITTYQLKTCFLQYNRFEKGEYLAEMPVILFRAFMVLDDNFGHLGITHRAFTGVVVSVFA